MVAFFKKNKAEVDSENVNYQFVKVQETEGEKGGEQRTLIIIHNPYGLKIRSEKQIAEVLGLSRSHVKKLIEQDTILIENDSAQFISIDVSDDIFEKEM